MASPYLKAALLTVALTFLGFFFISQFDSMRASELRSQLDELSYQLESERLMFLYSQTIGSQAELCSYFATATESKANKAYLLAEKIRQYEQSNILNAEYEKIRNQYYLSNAALYLNLRLAEKYCAQNSHTTILFFYKIKQSCPECAAQGKILDALREKHPNLRVFAFPHDADLPFLNALVRRHGITQVPALVIDDKTVLFGLQADWQIEAAFDKD
ncbi:MAG: conjugal transfer protein TraF [Candidatus Micrarchaeota archaeon]|nr:conjugal transfer protein TraF [Candidatus Micrarchaeota archaeon]